MASDQRWGASPFNIHYENEHPRELVVSGRDRWALECLMAAGEKGCSPIETPGPRWSGYVFNLRHLGVAIETVTEPHDGPFAGNHARYVLRCRVTRSEGANA